MDTDTTVDAFLNGRLRLMQPRRGYRAGSDPVLLAACVPARPGDSLLDLGCGAGAAMLSVATRVPGVAPTGIELQAGFAGLARRNADLNGIAATVHLADIAAMPADLRQQRFDHVISNPPYFDRRTGSASPTAPRETALGEGLALSDWIAAGARRLLPRGTLTVIQKADRLPDLLAAMDAVVGSLSILPIRPRQGRDAILTVVQGIKEGRTPTRILPDFILHNDGPEGTFTPAADAVLRDAAAIRLFGRHDAQ